MGRTLTICLYNNDVNEMNFNVSLVAHSNIRGVTIRIFVPKDFGNGSVHVSFQYVPKKK